MDDQVTITPISAISLLKDAFRIFEKKFWPLATVSFFGNLANIATSFVVVSAIALLSSISGLSATIAWATILPAAIVLSLCSFVFQIWSIASLLFIANELNPIKIRQAYQQTINKIVPCVWSGFLTITIIIAGLAAFLIPGFVGAVWFCFALVFVVVENKNGVDSLIASKILVNNYWWFALKFLSLALTIIIVATYISSLLGLPLVFQSLLVNTMANGFFATALLALYKKLSVIKGILPLVAAKNQARFYLAATIGTIVALLVITAGIFMSVKYTNDAARFYDSQILQQALVDYKQKQGVYPNSLYDLVPDFLPVVPTDPLTGNLYPYESNNDKKDFNLTINYDHFQAQTLSSQSNNLPNNK